MLEQILTQAVSHVQQITAILILAAVVLELIHIGQTRRINKKLSYAGSWLQRYLHAVFDDEAQNLTETEEEIEEITRLNKSNEMHMDMIRPVKSRQEEDMRNSIAQKKLKKDEELLDTVLQEIFD